MTQEPTQLWWIRHLPVDGKGRYIGHTDIEAIIPAQASSSFVPSENSVWFSSPLQRCVATANWLGAPTPLALVDAFKEQHFGAWEGRSYDEVWQESQHTLDWSAPERIKPPAGEDFVMLCERVESRLAAILKEHVNPQSHLNPSPPPQPSPACGRGGIVIIAHAGVIRAGLRHALNLTHAQALSLQVDYASVTHITYYGSKPVSARVEYVNRLL